MSLPSVPPALHCTAIFFSSVPPSPALLDGISAGGEAVPLCPYDLYTVCPPSCVAGRDNLLRGPSQHSQGDEEVQGLLGLLTCPSSTHVRPGDSNCLGWLAWIQSSVASYLTHLYIISLLFPPLTFCSPIVLQVPLTAGPMLLLV